MSAQATPCPKCAAPIEASTKFCGQCGFAVQGGAGGPKQTMLGMAIPRELIGAVPGARKAAEATPSTPDDNPFAPAPAAAMDDNRTIQMKAHEMPEAVQSAGDDPKKTMLGIPASMAAEILATHGAGSDAPAGQAPASEAQASAEQVPASAPSDDPKRTMLGLPAGMGVGPEPAAKPVTTKPAPADPAPAEPAPSPKANQRTMMGMPAVGAPAGGFAAPAPQGGAGGFSAAPAPAVQQSAAKAVEESPPEQPAAAAEQSGAQGSASQQSGAPEQSGAPARTAPSPNTNRTMLGVVAPAASPAQASSSAPSGGANAGPAAKSNRTMLGAVAPVPGAVPSGQTPQRAEPEPHVPEQSPQSASISSEMPELPHRGPKLGTVLAVLAALLLIGAGVAAVFLLRGGPEIRVAIEGAEEGEMLAFDVLGAVAGTKLRFDGEEVELEAGRGRFAVSPDDLHLGENTFVVDVVAPDGSSEQTTVVLSLPFRVRADLAALEGDEPSLRIVVDALNGSTVTLDEEEVALDDSGHGAKTFELDPASDAGSYERSVHYRVVQGDAVFEGEVPVSIPFASLEIDRPGPEAITDRGTVEIAGAAHPDAQVQINGESVEVNDEGRFLVTRALQSGENELRIVASQPQRAPRLRVLRLRRVADLAAEAAGYAVNGELTYSRVAGDADAYRGQRVAFTGRVYNVNVHEGRSALQIVVSECPRGERCPLWVRYDGAAPAELNSWVRVLGELAGQQQFRSRQGEVRSVPRLDAAFVLPAQEPRRR